MANKPALWKKLPWLLLAYSTLALGIVGAFLPVLPTTPFLLVTVWAGSHASSKFKWRLLRHKRFGLPLRQWYRSKAVAKPAKVLATVLILFSWFLIIQRGSPLGVIVFTGLILFSCIAFLLTRPEPDHF